MAMPRTGSGPVRVGGGSSGGEAGGSGSSRESSRGTAAASGARARAITVTRIASRPMGCGVRAMAVSYRPYSAPVVRGVEAYFAST
jgi:hypothetical protein